MSCNRDPGSVRPSPPHPNLRAAANNYAALLEVMGLSQAEVLAKPTELGAEFDIRPGGCRRPGFCLFTSLHLAQVVVYDSPKGSMSNEKSRNYRRLGAFWAFSAGRQDTLNMSSPTITTWSTST
jgi:hypothetical protein